MENQKTSSDKIEKAYIYKCRLCGCNKQGPTGYFTIIEAVITLLDLQTENITHNAGATISNTDIHNCTDGNLGIADLIGVVNVK